MTMDDPLTGREREESGGGGQPAVPVALREVSKLYRHGQNAVRALDGVSAEFARHSFTAVMGPSGSGKSTLLHCAAGLERPTSGTVRLAGQDLARLSEKRLTRLRRSSVGFVFQAFNLVPVLSVRENVVLPLRLAHARWDKEWPEEIIRRVGLEDRVRHRPAELSGGQEQRVAIARALVPGRRSSSATSPRERWTAAPPRMCSGCCARQWTPAARPWSWSPMTRSRRPTRTGWCSWPTARSWMMSRRPAPGRSPNGWPGWAAGPPRGARA